MLDLDRPKPTQIEYYAKKPPLLRAAPMDLTNFVALHIALWLFAIGCIILWNLPSASVLGLVAMTFLHARSVRRERGFKK